MAISASFLWRFLDDVWDLLPSEDRSLFETYWSAKLQVAGNLEQKAIEASLSTEMARVPVYLTERWNRFVMEEGACDLFLGTEEATLTGVVPFTLARETPLYQTLVVTGTSGQVSSTETMRLFDNSVRSLRYGDIVAGTVSVSLSGFEFTQNRDYAINRQLGTIQALDGGRIPTDQTVTIRYSHASYSLGDDYVVDEVYNTVTRTTDSNIPDGGTVAINYTYNGTPTVPLQGSDAIVDFATLTDTTKDFSSLLPNRTITIDDGPNAGTYTVNDILSPTQLQIVESFPSPQNEVSYSINAFPHGIRVSSNVASIPILQDRIDEPEHILLEGVDYQVQGGILSLNAAFPTLELGPESMHESAMWAEETLINDETPYRNFGVLLDFYRENSEAYKLALQGLWYAFWTGSTPGNLQRGLHILLGFPYAREDGTITAVTESQITLLSTDGLTFTYVIPDGVEAVVAVGDSVSKFDSLTTGIELIDRNSDPGFVTRYLGRAGIAEYLTSRATRGFGNTDETKALELLEHHLFVPRILVDSIETSIDVGELVTFLTNMKPAWTDFVLMFSQEGSDEFTVGEDELITDVTINLTATVTSNEWNQGIYYDSHQLASDGGEIIAGGTQATGNFRDLLADMVTLGIDKGDVVKILAGPFAGSWLVLKRISTTTLSLDIPDADIFGATSISYEVHVEERGLSHDGLLLKREHIILPGTTYSAPATLNTKTDADFLELDDEEVVRLLLVDENITGAEVQAITAADVENGEFDVATPPSPGAQSHEISSAALKRTQGATVTAYAI